MSLEKFWFYFPFRVRYSEIDAQGVVFNAHYLTYFDTSITEYFRALGYDQYAHSRKTGIDVHVVKSLIEYKAPVLFDWELEVGARVARIGNSSLTFELAIFRKGGTDALVTGEIVWVYTDQNTHRPVPIPQSSGNRSACAKPIWLESANRVASLAATKTPMIEPKSRGVLGPPLSRRFRGG